MKQIFSTIKVILLIVTVTLSNEFVAQCKVSYNPVEALSTKLSFIPGQGFTAECSGNLEYVQLISNSKGKIPTGILAIFEGNEITKNPIYVEKHPEVVIQNAGDPIRINLTDTLTLKKDGLYIFQFQTSEVEVKLTNDKGYSKGRAFQNEVIFDEEFDFLFEVSISESTLSIEDNRLNNQVNLYPNPAKNYTTIFNLKEDKKYKIFNVLGKEIRKGIVGDKEKINLRDLKNGMYFLKLEDGATFKILKK